MGVGAGIAAAGAIGAVGSIASGAMSAGAAGKAADLSQQQYQTTRKDLLPYADAGRFVLNDLVASAQSGPYGGGKNYLAMAEQNLPGQMTQAELEKTPGYQFNLAQGLKATQSAAAARGLGVSGAALKGAATYATGLADSTYQNQFNNAQTRYSDILGLNTGQQGNLTNQFNRLNSVATLGENAAASTGVQGTALANQAGQALIAGGNAQAAGIQGAGNAITGAVGNYLGYQALQKSLGTGQTGGYPAGVQPAPIDMSGTATGAAY